ncbi:MAG: LamG-like jellyroll fold domain-containing protein [Pirellula sp.]
MKNKLFDCGLQGFDCNFFGYWGFAILAMLTLSQGAVGQSTSKPAFQYQSGDIRVSVPWEGEPRVTAFGPASLSAAAKYLEDGALSWVREKSCVNCHTTGPYLVERTAWSRQFGPPSAEVHSDFVRSLPKEVKPIKETEKNGHKFYPGAFTSVWRALGLAEWDRNVTKKISEPTERALRDMFEHQSDSGAFVSHGEVEIPHITTDFELSLQAARAITAAPEWLAGLKDDTLRNGVAKLKTWLQTAPPKNDFDRVLKLQLAHYMPELVSPSERDAAIHLLSSKQHADGGWSTRDMSPVDDWHFEMSPYVLNLIKNLPDAAKPESDAYMTALAIVLMRQSNVPATDPRIARGLTWLKREQRQSGRWWMHSLYRGNYHYITYIATVEAMKALDLCGELSSEQGQTIEGTQGKSDIPNPIAHWKLDDEGREALDIAGGHHGTIHGARSDQGKVGRGLSFVRAQGDHVSIPYSKDFELGTFSVAAWVRLTKPPTFSGILGTREGGEFNFDMKVNTDKVHGDIGDGSRWIDTRVNFYEQDVGTNGQGGKLEIQRWYLVTFVIDNEKKQCRLYLDHDLKKTIPFTGEPRLMRPGQTMHIGNTGNKEFMDGVIDDVQIWKVALTDDHVASYYQRTK